MNRKRDVEIEKIHDNDVMYLKLNDQPLYAKLLDKEDFYVDKETNSIKLIKKVEHEFITQMASYIYYFDNIGKDEKVKINEAYIMTVSEDVDETLEEDNQPTILKFYEAKETLDDSGNFLFEQCDEIDLGNGDYRICYKLAENNVITDVRAQVGDEFIYYKNVVLNGDEYEVYNEDGNIERTISKNEISFNQFKIRTYTAQLNTHDIVAYNNVSYDALSGRFEFNEPVVCFFVTAVFNLGSSVYSKNVKQMVIVPDTLLDTEVDFGYETKSNTRYFNAYTGTTFSFDNLDFDNLSFESEGFAKAYVKRTRLKNVNYIRFIFRNSSNNNCKISNLTVVYEYGKKNKGVA